MEQEISRNKEHEIMLGVIYQTLVLADMKQEIDVKQMLADAYDCEFEDVPVFAQQIMIYSIKNLATITEAFQANMAKWRFDRLNKLEQALLILSYTHFYYIGNIDRKIVIDIAIKLAKKFLDKDDYKFVNAILDNTLKDA